MTPKGHVSLEASISRLHTTGAIHTNVSITVTDQYKLIMLIVVSTKPYSTKLYTMMGTCTQQTLGLTSQKPYTKLVTFPTLFDLRDFFPLPFLLSTNELF